MRTWTRRPSPSEWFLTVDSAGAGSGAAAETYQFIGAALRESGAQILQERIYGSLDAHAEVMDARAGSLRDAGLDPGTPVTYIDGRPLSGSGLAGVHILATTAPVTTFSAEGDVRGRVLRMPGARWLYLAGVHGLDAAAEDASAQAQAGRMFARAGKAVASLGGSFADVARTWIYLSDILGWYNEFNVARNAQFRALGLIGDAPPTYLPASTGISGDNPLGAAGVMDVLAILRDDPEAVEVRLLHNPRQNEAFTYRSAFARGMYVRDAGAARAYVSGCAAIDNQGQNVCIEDAEGQVRYTLVNVEAILGTAGMSLKDTCQATAFLKRPEDLPALRKVAAEFGLDELPVVTMHADVCRPELLFEIDVLAAVGQ